MKVFVTGATGWVGSAVVRELREHGHDVSGLSRSDAGADRLRAAGAIPVRGALADLDTLRDAAAAADAVLHLGFEHDFSRFAAVAEQDRVAIGALGDGLAGSDRPLVVTSGVALLAPGRIATEDDMPPADPSYPRRSEAAAQVLAARGVRTAVVRLSPSTHGIGELHGFVPMLIDIARRTGVSAYPGDGSNRWPGVHRNDAARLYRLLLERNVPRYAFHATAEQGIPFRDIAAAIGTHLDLPTESRPVEHFGWFGGFVAADMPASSALTRAALDWEPTGPGLLADIADPAYYAG